MSAVLPSTILERFVTALTADPPGFTQARVLAELYGYTAGSLIHQGFAVSSASTTPGPARQRASRGAHVDTRISVVWSWRLRPTDQWADYKAALDAEQTLIAACLTEGSSMREDIQITMLDAVRNIHQTGEWVLGELTFSARHLFSLT
tara:strand:- start:419 stop:862 length:444 start_codon:yes stop_codon:yes gene_type:complete